MEHHCYTSRFFALKYAADAACTIVRVDQIIMAKQAGGPKRDPAAGMDEDYNFVCRDSNYQNQEVLFIE
ncbi:hypothetical protein AAC387_Pa09g0403 [Persea americana]